MFMQLSLECMSEESSDSEQEDMVVHKPAWRSRGKIISSLMTGICTEYFLRRG